MKFNPSSRDIENPYALYEVMRAHDPLHQSEEDRIWYTFNYELAEFFFRNKQCLHHNITRAEKKGFGPTWEELFNSGQDYFKLGKKAESSFLSWFIFFDEQRHASFRKILSKYFSPKNMAAMEGEINQYSIELFEKLFSKKEFEFNKEYARPFAFKVLASLLGIPESHQKTVFPLTDHMANIILIHPSKQEKATLHFAIIALAREFNKYITKEIIATKNSLIDIMLTMYRDSELTADEFITQCVFLTAATESTSVSSGNNIFNFKNQPHLNEILLKDPSTLPSIMTELIRFDGPVECSIRIATEDIHVYGKVIKQGEKIGILTGAANRDPQKFDNPNVLNIHRKGEEHLSFGIGRHHCLGAYLAKVENECTLMNLVKHYPNFYIKEKSPERISSFGIRGFKKLTFCID